MVSTGLRVAGLDWRLTHRVCYGEYVDGHDHHPSADTVIGVDAVGGVEHAHEDHADEDQDAAIEGGGASTPLIDEHESYDSGYAD